MENKPDESLAGVREIGIQADHELESVLQELRDSLERSLELGKFPENHTTDEYKKNVFPEKQA